MNAPQVIGIGAFNEAIMSRAVTKKSNRLSNARVSMRVMVLEASILRHLNSYSKIITTDLMDYYPFPVLYDCMIDVQDPQTVTTQLVTNYVGRSLDKILDSGWSDIVTWLDTYYDKLAQVIGIMHSCGVVHGDLHVGNITIDSQDRIHLIDFGASCIGNKPFILVSTVPGPLNIPQADLWRVAASCVIEHTDEDVHPSREWALRELRRAYPDLDYNKLKEAVDAGTDYIDGDNIIELYIPIPPTIPQPLNDRLRNMLAINVDNRRMEGYEYHLIRPQLSWRWKLSVPRSDKLEFVNSLEYLLSLYTRIINNISPGIDRLRSYSVVVGIDLLCRLYHRSSYVHNRRMTYINAIVPLSISEGIITKSVSSHEVAILELLEWKIFTLHNTSLPQVNTSSLIEAIRNDTQRAQYVTLPSDQLMDRIRDLL